MDPAPTPPRRILYVVTKASWGGAQRYVYDLALAMKKEGHEVAVIYGEEGPLVEKLESISVRTLPVPSLRRDLALKEEWNALRALIALMKEEKPDLVHVSSSKAGLALLAARIVKVPRILFTAHGWAFNEKRPWWQKLLIRAAYVVTVLLSDLTICVSAAVRRDLGPLPFMRTRVIHNGIGAPTFLSREEARRKLFEGSEDGRWLGMVAELHPTKRVEDVLAALAELSPLFPDLRLVVMGDGELREWLERVVIHYGLEKQVRLAGFVPQAAEYLKAFDLFVLASRTEALAYALVEAGHAGLPVVATRVGGVPEVVEHKRSGLLVPPENPHALARAIRDLLADEPQARAYGEALRARVAERFGEERMLRETLEAYGFDA